MNDSPKLQQFVKLAVASRLVSGADVESCLAALPENDRSAESLARALVKAGHLTEWHTQRLLKGKRDRFFLGSYKVLDFLGRGGMGVVYLAEHTFMRRKVALKVLPSQRLDRGAKERFIREVQVGAQINHPNLVDTYDAGEQGQIVFMAVEFVPGHDLATIVSKRGPLDVESAVDILRQALCGLDYAHQKGIVHRDIKPQNIMFSHEGEVKILDMGLARILDDASRESDPEKYKTLTRDGAVLGTPPYMAPEQFSNARDADIRSDLNSLGCTLYFLLTGRHAFDSDSIYGIIALKAQETLPPLSEHCPQAPGNVEELYHRLTAKDPLDRFQTPREAVNFIEGMSSGTVGAPAQPGGGASATVDWKPPTRSTPGHDARAGRAASPTPQETPDRPSPYPEPTVVTQRIGGLDVQLCRVPAGQFLAGCPRAIAEDLVGSLAVSNADSIVDWLCSNRYERRQVDDFWIARLAVTNELYARFVDATGYRAPSDWPGGRFRPADAGKPVTGVSLDDAQAFCQWAGVRIPTTDEWEKAARGTDGQIYPWGNTFDDRLCSGAEVDATGTVDVDMFPDSESPYGARQMVGNIWEWTARAADGTCQLRGGSYQSSCSLYGAAFTPMKADPTLRREHFGFRFVVDRPVGEERPVDESAAPPVARPTPRPRSAQQSPRDRVREQLEAQLVRIPAGPFVKGLNRQFVEPVARSVGLTDIHVNQLVASGSRRVTVPEFQIARCCVSNGQYLAFVQDQQHSAPAAWDLDIVDGRREADAEWRNLPVCGISYHDAVAFCQWAGFRLPTEDEWEKAARGDRDDRIYPWGNQFDAARCNGAESGLGRPISVESLPEGASPYGLLNAAGNVLEWVKAAAGTMAPLKGGSYQVSCSIYALIGYQMAATLDHVEESFGVRVVR